MQGWIKIHKKILESESLSKFNRAERWCFLEILCSATHVDYEYSDHLFSTTLRRGEQVFNITEWSKEWELTYNQTNYLLHRFEKLGLITIRNERHRIILNIPNYSKYQGKNEFSRTIEEVSKNFSRTISDKTIDNIEENENTQENFQEVFKNYSRTPQNHLYIQEDKEAKNNIYSCEENFLDSFNEIEVDEIINTEANEFVEKMETEVLHQPKKEKTENIQQLKYPEDSNEMLCVKILGESILTQNPKKKIDIKSINSWAHDFNLTHRIDGYEWGEIEKVLRWAVNNSFWKTNVKSGSKFRLQIDNLIGKMQYAGTNKNNKPKFDRETITREYDEMSELINKSEVFKNNK